MQYPEYRVREVPLDEVDYQVLKSNQRVDVKMMKWIRITFLALFGLYGLWCIIMEMPDLSFLFVPAIVLIMWIGLEIKERNEGSLLDHDIKKGTKQVLEGYITKKTITRVQEHTVNSISYRYEYNIEVGPREYKITKAAFERLREGQPIKVFYLRISQHVFGMSFPDSHEPADDAPSGTKDNLPVQPS
jgi:hypothetical protein